jgi:hypothetical protein
MLTKSVAIPEDILLWPDNFWCFRNELSNEFLRADDYRVVSRHSDEWLSCTRDGTPPRYARQQQH